MAQRANRVGLAFLFGTAAGVVGTAVFAGAVLATAPFGVAAAAGFLAAYFVGEYLKTHKENWFAKRPDLFGH